MSDGKAAKMRHGKCLATRHAPEPKPSIRFEENLKAVHQAQPTEDQQL